MNRDDLNQALGEVKESFIDDAIKIRMQKKKEMKRRVLWLSMACAILICIFAGTQLMHQKETIQTAPEPTSPAETTLPAATIEPEEQSMQLPLLTVGELKAGGMGFDGLDSPDLKKDVSGNPWTSEMNLSSLPVWKNPHASDAGFPIGYSEEELRQKLQEFCQSAGYHYQDVKISTIGANNDKIEEDTVYEVSTETKQAKISIEGDGTITVFLNTPQPLPAEYHFSSESAEKDALDSITYIYQIYSSVFGIQDAAYDVSYDYKSDGTINRHYRIYEKAASNQDTVVNYAFNYVEVYPDESGSLRGYRIFKQCSNAEKMGSYPLITYDQAYQSLISGQTADLKIHYTFNYQPTADDIVGRSELVYRTSAFDQYWMPYYRFYIDITDTGYITSNNGLRTYIACYVPAVDPAYLVSQ